MMEVKVEPEDVPQQHQQTCDSDDTYVNMLDIFKVEDEGVELRSEATAILITAIQEPYVLPVETTTDCAKTAEGIEKQQLQCSDNTWDNATHDGGGSKLGFEKTKLDIKLEPEDDLAEQLQATRDIDYTYVKMNDLFKVKKEEVEITTEAAADLLTAIQERDEMPVDATSTNCSETAESTTLYNTKTSIIKREKDIMNSKHEIHSNVFVCEHCNCKFSSKQIFIHHMSNHTSHVCKNIRKSKLNSKQKPKLHIDIPHTTDTDKSHEHKINYQENKPSSKKTPDYGISVNQSPTPLTFNSERISEKPYSCSQCSKSFTRSSQLTIHMRKHTGEKPYSCSQCSKSFTSNGVLTKHMRIHTDVKPYSCSQCSKSFISNVVLTRHLRIHDGVKPYSCSQCKKSFARKSCLTKHIRIHTGEKPYTCSQCSKSFTYMNHLTVHMRIHTGEKPYSCNQCSKSFTATCHLTSHMRKHTSEKIYSCSQCCKSFSRSSRLTVHMRIHTYCQETTFM